MEAIVSSYEALDEFEKVKNWVALLQYFSSLYSLKANCI